VLGRDDLRAGLAHDRFSQDAAIAFYVESDAITVVAIFLWQVTLTRALRGDVDKECSVS
jgi:hypothetical protein